MKDLQEILREKELAVQRLEKEIESLRIVLTILDEEELRAAMAVSQETPTPAPVPAPPAKETKTRSDYPAAANQGRTPPVAPPFSASSSSAQGTTLVDVRKPAPRNWP